MADSMGNSSGQSIQSVGISLKIIETIQKNGKMGMIELADELGRSKSTIYNHLYTLQEGQLIVRDPDGYRLSLRTLDMANHVRDEIGNFDVIQSEVDALVDETGEIVQFGIEEYGKVSYLYKKTGERGMESASRVGQQQPMYSTGLGKAILAHLPENRRREIINQTEFEQVTPNSVENARELRENLAAIREQGYAIDDEENFEGIRCIAAPVKGEDSILGAVSITGPSSRITLNRIHDELADQIKRATNIIELKTKFAE